MVATTLPAVVRVVDLPTGTTVTGAELFEAVQTSGGVGQSVQLSLTQMITSIVGALPTGGGTGQILNKTNSNNFSTTWSSITQFVAVGTSLATTGSATSIVAFVANQGITSTQILNNAVGTNQVASSLGIASSLSVGGLLTVGGTATVTGTTILSGGLQVTGTTLLTGVTGVVGTSQFTGAFNVVGTSIITGIFGVVGTSQFTGAFNVLGTTLFTSGTFGIVGTTNITGTLGQVGTSLMTGAFGVVGTSQFTGIFNVLGTSQFTGTHNVVGTSTITGVFNVIGTTLFTSGTFGVVGTTLFTSTFGIVGTSQFTGAFNVVGTSVVTGSFVLGNQTTGLIVSSSTGVATATTTVPFGLTITSFNAGNATTGTITPTPVSGNYQYLANNGAFTLAAYTSFDFALDLLLQNGTAPGAITFSGWRVGNVGDTFSTTARLIASAVIATGSPGIVTCTAHLSNVSDPVWFSTSGTLPTGVSSGLIYYISTSTANTFQIATTAGTTTSINLSGAQSGTHTATFPSQYMFSLRSIHSVPTYVVKAMQIVVMMVGFANIVSGMMA